MSSVERTISILELFSREKMEWSADEILREIGCSRATLYRYLKMLTNVDLLMDIPSARYTLGPKIAELDYDLRTSDPIVSACRPIMKELVADWPAISLLCRLYRDRVLCIYRDEGNDAPTQTIYERGKSVPLVRGASARAIMAQLPLATQRRIYNDHESEFSEIGLGNDFATVRNALRNVSKERVCIARGEIVRNYVGIAAPVVYGTKKIIGSLSVTVDSRVVSESAIADIVERVRANGEKLTELFLRP